MSMRRVFKYQFNGPGVTVIHVSLLAEIVLIARDPEGGLVTIWMAADWENEPRANRTFFIAATGDAIPDGAVHRGSAIDAVGFAWHVFELMPWNAQGGGGGR